MAINEKYSFKDLTGQDFSEVDAAEFNDSEIVGSCFYQENKPYSEIFPAGMTGVVFKRCNLDNCVVPAGNEMVADGWEKCSNKQIHVQNDLRDWEIDADLKAVRPLHDDGGNSNPALIPAAYVKEETINKLDYDIRYGKPDADLSNSWYLTKPTIQDTIVRTMTVETDQATWEQMQAKANFYPFSAKPTLVETKDAPANDGRTAQKVVLKGTVTEYQISGEGKVYKGQTETINPAGTAEP